MIQISARIEKPLCYFSCDSKIRQMANTSHWTAGLFEKYTCFILGKHSGELALPFIHSLLLLSDQQDGLHVPLSRLKFTWCFGTLGKPIADVLVDRWDLRAARKVGVGAQGCWDAAWKTTYNSGSIPQLSTCTFCRQITHSTMMLAFSQIIFISLNNTQ